MNHNMLQTIVTTSSALSGVMINNTDGFDGYEFTVFTAKP